MEWVVPCVLVCSWSHQTRADTQVPHTISAPDFSTISASDLSSHFGRDLLPSSDSSEQLQLHQHRESPPAFPEVFNIHTQSGEQQVAQEQQLSQFHQQQLQPGVQDVHDQQSPHRQLSQFGRRIHQQQLHQQQQIQQAQNFPNQEQFRQQNLQGEQLGQQLFQKQQHSQPQQLPQQQQFTPQKQFTPQQHFPQQQNVPQQQHFPRQQHQQFSAQEPFTGNIIKSELPSAPGPGSLFHSIVRNINQGHREAAQRERQRPGDQAHGGRQVQEHSLGTSRPHHPGLHTQSGDTDTVRQPSPLGLALFGIGNLDGQPGPGPGIHTLTQGETPNRQNAQDTVTLAQERPRAAAATIQEQGQTNLGERFPQFEEEKIKNLAELTLRELQELREREIQKKRVKQEQEKERLRLLERQKEIEDQRQREIEAARLKELEEIRKRQELEEIRQRELEAERQRQIEERRLMELEEIKRQEEIKRRKELEQKKALEDRKIVEMELRKLEELKKQLQFEIELEDRKLAEIEQNRVRQRLEAARIEKEFKEAERKMLEGLKQLEEQRERDGREIEKIQERKREGQKTQEAVTKTANLLYNFLDPVTRTRNELVTSSNIRRAILDLAQLLNTRKLTKQ